MALFLGNSASSQTLEGPLVPQHGDNEGQIQDYWPSVLLSVPSAWSGLAFQLPLSVDRPLISWLTIAPPTGNLQEVQLA